MEIPGYIGHHLRPYQLQGVEFLFQRYARGSGGVLADDMGLVIAPSANLPSLPF